MRPSQACIRVYFISQATHPKSAAAVSARSLGSAVRSNTRSNAQVFSKGNAPEIIDVDTSAPASSPPAAKFLPKRVPKMKKDANIVSPSANNGEGDAQAFRDQEADDDVLLLAVRPPRRRSKRKEPYSPPEYISAPKRSKIAVQPRRSPIVDSPPTLPALPPPLPPAAVPAAIDYFNRSMLCDYCGHPDDLLLCSTCPSCCHEPCLSPPLVGSPPEPWRCRNCLHLTPPTILAAKWTFLNGSSTPTRLFRFLPAGQSYIHAKWVADIHQTDAQVQAKHQYLARIVVPEPPMEPGPDLYFAHPSKRSRVSPAWSIPDGVHPDWLTIERIISSIGADDPTGRSFYVLVKWRQLPYDKCTWESRAMFDADIFNREYNAFLRRNDYEAYIKASTTDLPNDKEPPPPLTSLNLAIPVPQFQIDAVNYLRSRWYRPKRSAPRKNAILAYASGFFD